MSHTEEVHHLFYKSLTNNKPFRFREHKTNTSVLAMQTFNRVGGGSTLRKDGLPCCRILALKLNKNKIMDAIGFAAILWVTLEIAKWIYKKENEHARENREK